MLYIFILIFSFVLNLEASICFEGIDCTNYNINRKLKSLLIKNPTNAINADISTTNTRQQDTNIQLKNPTNAINADISTTNTRQQDTNIQLKNSIITKNTNNTYLLTDIITINYYNKTLKEVLLTILPKWNINIDDSLLDIKLDVIMQTTRKQAVIDLVNSLSAKVLFYYNTKPLPTVSIIKI